MLMSLSHVLKASCFFEHLAFRQVLTCINEDKGPEFLIFAEWTTETVLP